MRTHTHTHVYTPLLLSLTSHTSNWINWIFPGSLSGSLHIHKHFPGKGKEVFQYHATF